MTKLSALPILCSSAPAPFLCLSHLLFGATHRDAPVGNVVFTEDLMEGLYSTYPIANRLKISRSLPSGSQQGPALFFQPPSPRLSPSGYFMFLPPVTLSSHLSNQTLFRRWKGTGGGRLQGTVVFHIFPGTFAGSVKLLSENTEGSIKGGLQALALAFPFPPFRSISWGLFGLVL